MCRHSLAILIVVHCLSRNSWKLQEVISTLVTCYCNILTRYFSWYYLNATFLNASYCMYVEWQGEFNTTLVWFWSLYLCLFAEQVYSRHAAALHLQSAWNDALGARHLWGPASTGNTVDRRTCPHLGTWSPAALPGQVCTTLPLCMPCWSNSGFGCLHFSLLWTEC